MQIVPKKKEDSGCRKHHKRRKKTIERTYVGKKEETGTEKKIR